MKKFLFLILLITNCIFLNALGTLRIKSIKELPPTNMNISVRDADGKFAPVLIIKTELKGLGIKNVSRPTRNAAIYEEKKNQYKFYTNENQRVIELTHSKYNPLEIRLLADFNIDISAKRVYEIILDNKEEYKIIPIVITCNQNGAEIFVDGVSKGKTKNKMLTTNITTKSHIIRVEKNGFGTKELTKTISIKNNSFNFKLTPAMPAAVTIKTNPEGAVVYIDKLKFGTTPKSSFFDAGKYPIRIEKENYKTSYVTKDVDNVKALYSEDALIIIGKIIKRTKNLNEFKSDFSKDEIIYFTKTKKEHIQTLQKVFSKNKFVWLQFDTFKINSAPIDKVYGISMKQNYYSSTYKDRAISFC